LDAEVAADVERDTTVVLGAGLDVLERDDVVRLRNCRGHARAPFRDRASCATCSVASNALVPASIGCIAVSLLVDILDIELLEFETVSRD
jgi:hypothetical protein